MENNAQLALSLLGVARRVPLTAPEMARSLKVVFYPPHEQTPRLARFARRLEAVLRSLGVEILTLEEATTPEGKIRPEVVVFEQGEGASEDLAVRHLTSLYKNTVVGIYDKPTPIDDRTPTQEKLDTIVGVLAWNMIHIPIFLDEDYWSVYTMTGSVIQRPYDAFREAVASVLIPKLTAHVVPPDRSTITYRVGALDVEGAALRRCVDDFGRSARIWQRNGLMLAHTSLEDIAHRNRFFRRIVSAFLDERTGMSYGFMVRQLPTGVPEAYPEAEAPERLRALDWERELLQFVDGTPFARVEVAGRRWIAEVPDVWVLATRSGCEKTNINPKRDLVRMGLERGKIVFETPEGVTASEAQPSYDTHAILSHAVGNALVAGISRALGKNEPFARQLEGEGLSISHWHGYPPEGRVPEGYVLHGQGNPPVSCSTPQSAVYSLAGKLRAFGEALRRGAPYRGDVHVEPYHGTNICGMMLLEEAAMWVDRHCTLEEA